MLESSFPCYTETGIPKSGRATRALESMTRKDVKGLGFRDVQFFFAIFFPSFLLLDLPLKQARGLMLTSLKVRTQVLL